MMRSANPALGDQTFTRYAGRASTSDQVMSIQGTVNKTAFLLLLVVMAASWAWGQIYSATAEGPTVAIPGYIWGALIGAFVVSLIIIFKKETAPYLSPVYALLEGVVLGLISAIFEMKFPGIVFQAVLGTFGTLFALLFAYKSGLIKATENFRLGVVAATGGIALIYLLTMILGFFKISVPYIHESGVIGIGFSVFVCVIAALNLVLDFDFIEKGAESRAPKFMEWYAAFGLLITLVWLYMEILRLLSKSRSK